MPDSMIPSPVEGTVPLSDYDRDNIVRDHMHGVDGSRRWFSRDEVMSLMARVLAPTMNLPELGAPGWQSARARAWAPWAEYISGTIDAWSGGPYPEPPSPPPLP